MGGKGVPLLTLDERKQIELLLKQGRRTGNIAEILGRSHSCIKQEIAKNGQKANYSALNAHDAHELRNRNRIAKMKKGMTPEMEVIIREGIEKGLSQNQLSEKLNVSNFLVKKFIDSLNIKYKVKNYTGLERRIDSLELMVEILVDQIKELSQKFAIR